MRTLNEKTSKKNIKVIRLVSDNFDCWITEDAYKEVTLQMSSGDFGSHSAICLWVTMDLYTSLKDRCFTEGYYPSGKGLPMGGFIYWNDGDFAIGLFNDDGSDMPFML